MINYLRQNLMSGALLLLNVTLFTQRRYRTEVFGFAIVYRLIANHIKNMSSYAIKYSFLF